MVLISELFLRGSAKGSTLLSRLSKIDQMVYSLVSFVGALFGSYYLYLYVSDPFSQPLFSLRSPLACGALRHPTAQLLLEVYFWSKLYEAHDLVVVIARGYPINAHFVVHHISTPLFAWVGYVSCSAHGMSFLVLNCIMHTMLYAFFAGFSYNWLKSLLRFWQNVQLWGGILLCSMALSERLQGRPCTRQEGVAMGWYADTWPIILFLTYFALFRLELAEEAREMEEAKKKRK